MPLPSPNLDDRTFADLVAEGRARIARVCPAWTDLSPHDPGMVLLEVYAWLTEAMIFRLNRVPDKAFVEFLNLIGVRLQPSAAASATLRFSLAAARKRDVEIPRGTRVTTEQAGEGDAVVFVTSDAASIEAGKTEVDVLAHHCEVIEAERAGITTGLPGQVIRAQRPPIVASTGEGLDLVVGIEAAEGEVDARAPARSYGDKTWRVWREVANFATTGPEDTVYVVDRQSGLIQLAPAVRSAGADGTLADEAVALAAVPPAGREVRLWYRRGGGPAGNVAAETLTVMKDPIAGVSVTNPAPAVGGRAAETLENALIRGPQELHSLRRAVTASDFEAVALQSSGGVARARAFTQAQLWAHARPGTVEVVLVPHLPDAVRGEGDQGVSAATLAEHQADATRDRILAVLDERRPLGTMLRVDWARYKTVRVQAHVVAHYAEDPVALRQRLLKRLYQTITPLPTELRPDGWPFGRPLRASHVFDILLSEPGVSYLSDVAMIVDAVPAAVRALCADAHQPHTWYAGSGEVLFRSVDDADGWEPAGQFAGESIEHVVAHPDRPGLIAVATSIDAKRSRVHLSADAGETWDAGTQTLDAVNGLAWTVRQGVPLLLIATTVGLFELSLQPGATPLQVLVEASDQHLGFTAVAASTDLRGAVSVAVAAEGTKGVYLSSDGGKSGSWRKIGLRGEDVRVLRVQHDGPRSFLWAAVYARSGTEKGKGAMSWELLGSADPPDGWRSFSKGWDGGSCLSLAFAGSTVYAGSHHAGVLWLDAKDAKASWSLPDVDSNLPLREADKLFQPVQALATSPSGELLMAGGPGGVVRKRPEDPRYARCSRQEFTEKVSLPPTWLFCSGAHELTVENEDAAE